MQTILRWRNGGNLEVSLNTSVLRHRRHVTIACSAVNPAMSEVKMCCPMAGCGGAQRSRLRLPISRGGMSRWKMLVE